MARKIRLISETMAVFNLIVGLSGLWCGVAGYSSDVSVLGGRPPSSNPGPGLDFPSYLESKVPGYYYLEFGKVLLVLGLGIILILATIGLLRGMQEAKWVAIGYSLTTILLHSGYLVFEMEFMQPAVESWAMSHPVVRPGAALQLDLGGVMTGVILAAMFFLIHAFILLNVMLSLKPSKLTAVPSRLGEGKVPDSPA